MHLFSESIATKLLELTFGKENQENEENIKLVYNSSY